MQVKRVITSCGVDVVNIISRAYIYVAVLNQGQNKILKEGKTCHV